MGVGSAAIARGQNGLRKGWRFFFIIIITIIIVIMVIGRVRVRTCAYVNFIEKYSESTETVPRSAHELFMGAMALETRASYTSTRHLLSSLQKKPIWWSGLDDVEVERHCSIGDDLISLRRQRLRLFFFSFQSGRLWFLYRTGVCYIRQN